MWVFQNGVWFFEGEPVDDATQEILAPFDTFLNGTFLRVSQAPGEPPKTLDALHINDLAKLRGFEAPEGEIATGPDFLEDDEVIPQQGVDGGVPPIIGTDSRGNTIVLPWVPELQKWGLVDPITGKFSGVGPDDAGISPSLKQAAAAAELRGETSEANRLAIRQGELEALTREASGVDEAQFPSLQEAEDFFFLQGTDESLAKADEIRARREALSPSELAALDREMATAAQRNQLATDQQRLREEQFEFKQSEAVTDRLLSQQERQAAAVAGERERLFRIAQSPADIFTQSAIAGGAFGTPPEGGAIRRLPNQFLEPLLPGGDVPSAAPAAGTSQQRGAVSPSDVSRFQTIFKDLGKQGIEGQQAIDLANSLFDQPGSDNGLPPGQSRLADGAGFNEEGGPFPGTDRQDVLPSPIQQPAQQAIQPPSREGVAVGGRPVTGTIGDLQLRASQLEAEGFSGADIIRQIQVEQGVLDPFAEPKFSDSFNVEGGGTVAIPPRLKSTLQGKIASPAQSQIAAAGFEIPNPQQLRNLSADERVGLSGFFKGQGISERAIDEELRKARPGSRRPSGGGRITSAPRRI